MTEIIYNEKVPIQYEQRRADFMGMDIYVDERVFIPRPETELLVRRSADMLAEVRSEYLKILEIGTGSGIISIGLAELVGNADITALDISQDALDVARKNIDMRGLSDRIELIRSDMYTALGDEYAGIFDMIVSNPPYVSDRDYERLDAWVMSEPKIALRSGEEGMDHMNRIVDGARMFLKDGGSVCFEIGYDQAEKVKLLLKRQGYVSVETYIDSNGFERVAAGKKNG